MEHPRLIRFWRSLIIGLWPLLAVAGCQQATDLDSVRQLAQSAGVAQSSFSSLVADFHDSCVRTQRRYVLLLAEAAQPGALGSSKPPVARQHRRGVGAAQPSASSNPSAAAIALSQARSKYEAVATCDSAIVNLAMARWSTWNRLLLGYYVALGNIAGKKSDDSAYGIQSLGKSLQNNGLLANDAQTRAVSTAAISVIDALFDARRRNAIAEYASPNGPGTAFVNMITGKLENVAVDYQLELQSERSVVDRYYMTNIGRVPAGTEVLTGLQSFMKQWDSDDAAIDARVGAAHSYIQALESMKAAHEAIAEAIASNRPAQLANIVQIYLNEFQPEVQAINKAFSTKGTP